MQTPHYKSNLQYTFSVKATTLSCDQPQKRRDSCCSLQLPNLLRTMSDMDQLLELNIISAQDLAPVARQMRTYAVIWIHSGRKLSTRVDTGHANPTWNDKFVFRVDPNFLSNEMSAINIEIYAVHWFRNIRVGSVRLFLGNIFPPSDLRRRNRHGTRFVALQVWRPSGRPQGILNVGASVLDADMRGLKLYRQLSASAVGFKDLMDDNNSHLRHILGNDKIKKSDQKPVLIRSRSDRSELERKPTLELEDGLFVLRSKAGSVVGSEAPYEPKLKKVRSTSTTRSGLVAKPKEFKRKQKQETNKTKSRSLISGSTDNEPTKNYIKPHFKPRSRLSVMSMSELGPSPSEVVEDVRRRNPIAAETETSEEVSMLDESVEGLRSKMDRWRFACEPVMEKTSSSDRGTFTSNARTKHVRRHTDGGSGLFSCFGNVCGYECTVVCGRPNRPDEDGDGPGRSDCSDRPLV